MKGAELSEIVPRWEWRTFGDVASPFGQKLPERVQESDETYLLSVGGSDAVKIRDELMDIKHLVDVNQDGLEQWVPVMKAGFPLSVADVEAVLDALRLDAPPDLAPRGYTLRDILDEVVGPTPDLLAVEVHKRRERYTIGGCAAEMTEVRTGSATTRTIAIESEDPARVIEKVRELGLAARANVSFASGLKALLRFASERYAVVDVGTNSVKFHIGERSRDGAWRKVVDRAEVTRLGEGLRESGRLGAEPMRRTVEAIAGMAEEARQNGVAAVAAVGTAGLRIATNSAELVDAVQARCGVTVEVISGDEESRLAYLGATRGIGPAQGSRVVFDTGGGSSQFTFGQGERVDERFSVDVGAVRYTERYGLDRAVSEETLTEALAAISGDLGRLDDRPTPDSLVGMGGAVTNLAAVKHGLAEYDPDIVQRTVLDGSEIDRQIELYRTGTVDQRRAVVGLQPQRADIILAGACIVRTVLGKLGTESLTVSDRGLRHGVLMERFGPGSTTG
jgi:exopolyphosphatase / guanosine-5'-triphosphate,3'-diphosphate pyrophosphatase